MRMRLRVILTVVVGLDEEAISPPFSPRDSQAIIGAVDPVGSWLLQAETGRAHAITAGRVQMGAISPGGRWAVAQDAETETFSPAIIQLEGDKTVPLGEGYFPVWVHP